MTTLLIDCDPIAFNAALYAGGRDPAPAVIDKVETLKRQLGAGRAILAFSDASRRYWRHGLAPAYKAKRRPPPDNVLDARRGLDGHGRIVREIAGLEADDIVGVLATSGSIKGRVVVVADDKHLLTIPGLHHRPATYPPGKVCQVDRAAAECMHLQQTLVDYCPRVGEVGAKKVVTLFGYIESPAATWRSVVDAFEQQGRTADDALTAARVCRVCRASEFNFETLDVVPWQPPADDYSVRDTPVARAATDSVAATTAASMFPDDGPPRSYTS